MGLSDCFEFWRKIHIMKWVIFGHKSAMGQVLEMRLILVEIWLQHVKFVTQFAILAIPFLFLSNRLDFITQERCVFMQDTMRLFLNISYSIKNCQYA